MSKCWRSTLPAFRAIITQYREFGAEIVAMENISIREKLQQIAAAEIENDVDYILSDLPDLFRDTNEGLERISRIVKRHAVFLTH